MNRTKIEWTDFTWSPITGCTRGCDYCYARRMALRLRGRYGYPQDDPFAVTFHPDRLHEPSERKKPAKIFTCSMGELFDPTTELSWQREIFFTMMKTPRHTFQVLTKQPQNVLERYWRMPANCWLGVSYDGLTTTPDMFDSIKDCKAPVRFVSIEPFLKPFDVCLLQGLDWIIIGAMTGPRKAPPKKEWVDDVMRYARYHDIPIFLKDNLHWHEQVREWPKLEAER